MASGTITMSPFKYLRTNLTISGSYYNLASYTPTGYEIASFTTHNSGVAFIGGQDGFVYNAGNMTQITGGGTYDVSIIFKRV